MTTTHSPHTKVRVLVLVALLGGFALGAVVSLSLDVFADGDPATDDAPRQIPYQGILELNGQPVNATGTDAIPIRFDIFDGPDAVTPVYSQALDVEVFSGRFTAILGPTSDDGVPIADVIAAADPLHLGITLLNGAGEEDNVTLANRQEILATPFALWATSAAQFNVATDLNVGRNLRVVGDVDLAANAIDGDEITNGTITLDDIDTSAVFGEGLEGAPVGVDTDWLDGRIRNWVRSHCRVSLGWRDTCTTCNDGPERFISARANDTCTGASGDSGTKCRGAWSGLNTRGDVGGDDVFYIRMNCD